MTFDEPYVMFIAMLSRSFQASRAILSDLLDLFHSAQLAPRLGYRVGIPKLSRRLYPLRETRVLGHTSSRLCLYLGLIHDINCRKGLMRMRKLSEDTPRSGASLGPELVHRFTMACSAGVLVRLDSVLKKGDQFSAVADQNEQGELLM